MPTKFVLKKEIKDDMIAEIKTFFAQERNEELGDLAALFILEFFMEKLAPHFYNEGVNDSYQFLSEKLEDLFEIHK